MSESAKKEMRTPIETGCPDGFQYMHPTMRKNFGQWKYHEHPRPGVLVHVAHSGEEIFCVKAHLELKKKIKNLITIIIPRHISRANGIISEITKFNVNTITHSSKSKNFRNLDIYLVDTFGETKKFFKIASTVFLGGSIIKRGGQNPLEAARYGSKILHGQNIDNFKDVYKLLNSLNISKKVSNYHELASSISFLRNQKIGLKISKIGKIILKNTLKEIDIQIKNEFKKT